MPGICGIADTRPSDLDARLQRMLTAMRHEPWYDQCRFCDESGQVALGRMTLGYVNTQPQPAVSEEGNLRVVMDGELYDAAAARRSLADSGCACRSDSHAEIVLRGYQRGGTELWRTLHGSFVAAIWDAAARRLTLINDRFGMRPLYYAKLPGRLLFASSLRAILLVDDVPTTANLRGLAQFFSFGQYFGCDTSLEAINVAPAAAWIEYDLAAAELNVDRYYRLRAADRSSTDRQTQLADLDDCFTAAVQRRLEQSDAIGLTLSGGMDARTILSVIDPQRVPVRTVCYGMAGSLDLRCAARMAKLTGCRHEQHVLGSDLLVEFRDHLQRMVHLTDGQYLSQCIILPTLPLYRRLGMQVLLRGHAGELMHMNKAYAYSLDDEAMAIDSDERLERWLWNHLRAYMLEGVEGPLFRDLPRDEVDHLARASLRDALEEARVIDEPLQRIWYLFVQQRLRRETTLSLAKFGSVAEIRVPYLDNDLVELLLATPPDWKRDESIQRFTLARHKPELLTVVNANTGTRIGAGRMRQRLSTLRMRVLGKLGVPGYQPYERLGLWLRRELAPLVEEVLLSPHCLDEGVFDPDTTRHVVRQHFQRRSNHTFLLMAMMIHEIGRRSLADPDSAAAADRSEVSRSGTGSA